MRDKKKTGLHDKGWCDEHWKSGVLSEVLS
jgi:hypothetical protein